MTTSTFNIDNEILLLRESLRLEKQQPQQSDDYNGKDVLQHHQACSRLQFELASLLSCSSQIKHLRESSYLLREVMGRNYRRSDCLYQLALVSLKLGDYTGARRFSDSLLELEPHNITALSLRSLIIDRTVHDGLSGTVTFISLLAGLAFVALKWRPTIQHFLSQLVTNFQDQHNFYVLFTSIHSYLFK